MKRSIWLAALALAAVAQSAKAADPVTLKFGTGGPPTAAITGKLIAPWSEEVTKASDGVLDVRVYTGPSLVTLLNSLDRTLNGVADMAYAILGPYSSQFPKTAVATLPFEITSAAEGGTALWHLYQRGIIADEFDKVKLIAISAFANVTLHSRKPIRVMADMKGVKTSVQSRLVSSTISTLGGVPITMPVSELYESLQRGVIDCVAIGWPATSTYKVNEVFSNHTHVSLGAEVAWMMMNKDSYAKLPEKGKATIDKFGGVYFSNMMARVIDDQEKESIEITKGKGQSIYTLAPDEDARWHRALAPITEGWVKATPDGDKVLAAFREEIAKIRSATPAARR